MPVLQRSVNKADSCRCRFQWPGKKIKLDEQVVSEILVADATLNQVLRLAILKSLLRRKKKKGTNNNNNNNNNNSKPQQKLKHRLQQVADYQPGDCLKEGTQIFILLSVQQKL